MTLKKAQISAKTLVIMRILFTIFIALFSVGTAWADNVKTDVLAPYSTLTLITTGIVDQVIDPRTLHLQDGTIIRLIAIDIPGINQTPPDTAATQAFDLLTKITINKTYHFYQIHNQPVTTNRFGQILALAVERETGISLQDELLRNGLARVWDSDETGFDLAWMMAMEDRARQLHSGIWQEDAPTRMRGPNDIPAPGQLTVVTGRIESTITLENDIYLALTDRGLKGFTLHLPSNLRPQLTRINLDPFALAGRLVRARGVIEQTQGGQITIKHTWQIELLPQTLMPLDDKHDTIPTQQLDQP